LEKKTFNLATRAQQQIAQKQKKKKKKRMLATSLTPMPIKTQFLNFMNGFLSFSRFSLSFFSLSFFPSFIPVKKNEKNVYDDILTFNTFPIKQISVFGLKRMDTKTSCH
jgi:hypothetical protein